MTKKKSHYIKIICDEIFNENNFVNEIVWSYRTGGASKKESLPKKHDNLLVYRKTPLAKVNCQFERQYLEKSFMNSKKDENGKFYTDTLVRDIFEGSINIYKNNKIIKFNTSPVLNLSSERNGYPTQKPEGLLKLILEIFTNPKDLVLDFFGGSGTTMAVAEKTNRKWIVCDIGKLSYFTMQKRIIQIGKSKNLENLVIKYNKKPNPFITCTLGLYDLKKTLNLKWNYYLQFVSNLFDIDLVTQKISGVTFEGKKDNYLVKIWNYNFFKDSNIDENYLKNIHQTIGNRINNRIYIIAPANNIDFITDYYEIDNVRYYFLKIPYEVIKELHKIPFQKIKQPQSKNAINDLDEVIGFHFINPPEVKTELIKEREKIIINIREFRSQYNKNEIGRLLKNFETLSAVFIDKKYDNQQFIMTDSYFADELIPANNQNIKKFINSEEIIKKLGDIDKNGIKIELDKKCVQDKIMIIYTDIYGNDFTEVLSI